MTAPAFIIFAMTSIRRSYLLRSLRFSDLREEGLASAYRGKQLSEPGQPLPEDFPVRERLALAGYLAIEDITGAVPPELERAGLNQRETAAVLKALAERED